MGIRKFFNRKREEEKQEPVTSPQPLSIEGIPPAPLTPEPDDAEVAAQALLEMMAEKRKSHKAHKSYKSHETHETHEPHEPDTAKADAPRTVAYYKHLAWRMRMARESTRLRVTRFLAFVEQELKKPHLPTFGDGSLGLLEAELYKRLDIVEHEGGELLRRWQHCLALVTVRMMQATRRNENDNDNENDNSSTTEDTE